MWNIRVGGSNFVRRPCSNHILSLIVIAVRTGMCWVTVSLRIVSKIKIVLEHYSYLLQNILNLSQKNLNANFFMFDFYVLQKGCRPSSDSYSDRWVVRMWVWILTTSVVLMSLSKTLCHDCFSPPRSKWVPVRAELVCCVWLALYAQINQNVCNWAVLYSHGSWDGFRNDLWAWWAEGDKQHMRPHGDVRYVRVVYITMNIIKIKALQMQ